MRRLSILDSLRRVILVFQLTLQLPQLPHILPRRRIQVFRQVVTPLLHFDRQLFLLRQPQQLYIRRGFVLRAQYTRRQCSLPQQSKRLTPDD